MRISPLEDIVGDADASGIGVLYQPAGVAHISVVSASFSFFFPENIDGEKLVLVVKR